MRTTIEEPKILGWVILECDSKLKELTRDHGIMLPRHEALLLAGSVVDHVIAALRAMDYGHLIEEHFLSREEVEASRPGILKRGSDLRYLDPDQRHREAKRRQISQRIQRLKEEIVRVLVLHRSRLGASFRSADIKDVLLREPHGTSIFLERIFAAWRSTSPAQKFFLIGGDSALKACWDNRVPNKELADAIFHICCRGTLTSGKADIYSLDVLSMPTVSKHQISRARLFCHKIPLLIETISLRPFSDNCLSPRVPGLQRKLRQT